MAGDGLVIELGLVNASVIQGANLTGSCLYILTGLFSCSYMTGGIS